MLFFYPIICILFFVWVFCFLVAFDFTTFGCPWADRPIHPLPVKCVCERTRIWCWCHMINYCNSSYINCKLNHPVHFNSQSAVIRSYTPPPPPQKKSFAVMIFLFSPNSSPDQFCICLLVCFIIFYGFPPFFNLSIYTIYNICIIYFKYVKLTNKLIDLTFICIICCNFITFILYCYILYYFIFFLKIFI